MTLHTWLPSWLDSTTCQHIGTALLHFVWQATALCAIAAGLKALLKARSSQLLYAMYVSCLMAMAVCVPANLTILGRLEASRQNEVVSRLSTERDRTPASKQKGAGPASLSESSLSRSSSLNSASTERSSSNTALSERQSLLLTASEGSRPPTTDSRISAAISPPLSAQIGSAVMGRTGPNNRFASWLVAIWGVGATVMLIRLLVALIAGWKLALASRPVQQDSLLRLAQTQAKRLGLAVQPALAWCEGVSVPMVLEILRPIVLLPPSLATGLSPVQLEAILAHEFAHVRRLDPLVNIMQRVVESLLFFHPAVWYMSRLISDERENCCDDMVIAKSTNRLGYADALVRMAELCVEQRVPVTSLAATGRTQSDLKRRILRLLVSEPSSRPGDSFTVVVAVALAVAALISHGAMLMADDPVGETKTQQQAAGQQAAGQPEDLVAVLGEDRARIWGYTKQILVTADEQRLFVTESIGYVSIFDANTLKRIGQFRPHDKRCLDIALLDSDTRLITISVDGTARLWDVTKDTPERLDTFVAFDGTSEPAWLSMSVASQGRRAAIRSEEKITIVETRKNKLHVLTSIPNRGNGTTFNYVLSPDGRWLVACEDQETRELVKDKFGNMNFYVDAILAVWDLQGEEPVVASELKRKTVQQLHMSPDGTSLFGVDPGFLQNKETHQWALDGGQIRGEVESIPGSATVFSSTVWNSTGTRMAFGMDKGVEVLTKENDKWEPLKEPIKTGANAACAFLGDDSLIVARAPELQRWDLIDGTYRKRPGPKGHSEAVMGIMFDSRTNSLLSAGSDALREWSLDDMSSAVSENSELAFDDVIGMWPWGEKKGFLLRRSVDGANVIEGVRRSGKRMVSQFKLDFTSDYRQSAWCAVMHPTEEILATGHWDSRIRIWDVSVTPPEKLLEWEAHRGHVCDVAFSPDGKQIASVGWDHLTYVWSIESLDQKEKPKRQRMGKHLDVVRSVAWSSDGRYLAAGGEDGQILLWNMKNGSEKSLTQVEDGPVKQNHYDSKTVDTLQFNRDGTRLLSGDAKGRLTVWRLNDLKIEKRWLLSGWIWDAKYSPDEKMIATANYDGTVYLLRSPTP